MDTALIVLIITCGIWAVVASLLIARDLEKRGVPIDVFWLRLMVLKYLGQYRQLTLEENGRVGPLFYHYVVPLNIAVALVAVIIIRSLL